MSDDRSERLRQRRKQSQERVREESSSETAGEAEASKPSKPSEPDEQSDTETGDSSVKEEQVGTFMYLPESQKKELEKLYNLLKAEYEYEFDEAFEKNRAFYPLVVQYGLDSLDGSDASEIQERLDKL